MTVDRKELVLQELRRNPQGCSFSDLFHQLESKVSRRSLQRTLKELVDQAVVYRLGKAPTSVYVSVEKIPKTEAVCFDIPLSKEGMELAHNLQKKRVDRKPVGYHRLFLDSYEPNKTFYLSEKERSALMKMSGAPQKHLPAGTYARKIMDRLLIDLSWNSSRLEGNTYTLLETEQLLNFGEFIDEKSALDAQMILNHKDAIEYLIEDAEQLEISTLNIRNIHAMLSDGLLGNRRAIGSIREIPIKIHGTVFSPENIPAILEECLELIAKKASQIKDPFEAAFFLMVQIPYLQAFEDVNKRVSRLVGNIPLIKSNLCPLSFVDVPTEAYVKGLLSIYEFNQIALFRDVFLWAYRRSTQRYAAIRQEVGAPDPFYVRHRDNVRILVKDVVTKLFSKMEATQFIQDWAEENVKKPGRARFIELVEQELLSLTSGNIARYRLRQSQFTDWQEKWQR